MQFILCRVGTLEFDQNFKMHRSVVLFSVVFVICSLHEVCHSANLLGFKNLPAEENRGRGLFEGDIKLSEREEDALADGVVGAGILEETYRWPNRTIPYVISKNYSSDDVKVILSAMNEISEKTCIRFKPREDEVDFISVEESDSCSSYVGNQREGKQEVNLDPDGCIAKGTIIHELVHAIGFGHEQSRTDRDQYVRVIEENIIPEDLQNFDAYTSDEVNEFGVPYDYGSVMHYGPQYFVTEEAQEKGLASIVPIKIGVTLGQRKGLSELDALKINRMNCPNFTLTDKGTPCLSECSKRGDAFAWCYVNKDFDGPRKYLTYKDRCSPKTGQDLVLESEAFNGVVSTHGIPCGSECSQHEGTKYYWCSTIKKWKSRKLSKTTAWDYCSPSPGHDYHLNKCTSECDYHGKNYKWCYHNKGGFGWGYCSKKGKQDDVALTEEEIDDSENNLY